jgi:hypothetical protein
MLNYKRPPLSQCSLYSDQPTGWTTGEMWFVSLHFKTFLSSSNVQTNTGKNRFFIQKDLERLSPAVRRSGCEAHRSFPSSTKVKNKCYYISISLFAFLGVHMGNFTCISFAPTSWPLDMQENSLLRFLLRKTEVLIHERMFISAKKRKKQDDGKTL